MHERMRVSTVFAVKHVAHCTAAGCALFLARILVAKVAADLFTGFRLAATGAAIGKAGLAGPQLELFTTNDTGFNGKRHTQIW